MALDILYLADAQKSLNKGFGAVGIRGTVKQQSKAC
jgi:hypothetical protein